ncbi:MAG: DEAD/DEAH box helicase family protein [Rickettsiales bacterium]|jgi:SNF2 family DNA or RNA helicase|nr:DEAD/DEAH box helicase family protein [Rickettsiales bacterium]
MESNANKKEDSNIMQQFDNISNRLIDDLQIEIRKGNKISVAAACFSIYAYEVLKEQLNEIEELRFIFTSPSFLSNKTEKEKREFYIPRIAREKSLYGTEFEVRLRNQLNQKAISKECADWIRKKVRFKSNIANERPMSGFLNINADYAYTPLNGFTTADLGSEKGNALFTIINKIPSTYAQSYLRGFDEIWNNKEQTQDVTDRVLESIETIYAENSPEFIYMLTLYNIFSEFLEDIDDTLPNEATGFKDSQIWNKLFSFQKDAALAIIHKLEKFNGCILADSVGLGKTFTALSVIKYYENRNKNVLVLCPKKLQDNWMGFKGNYLNNPIINDRLRYDVLFHTDLLREKGMSNGIDLSRLNWSNYDLVVIDESHNFRNGSSITTDENGLEHFNRYAMLMDKIIKSGVKTKVLMLSATPVNNRFVDLKNQLELAYEGAEDNINSKLNTQKSLTTIFNNAQRCFNEWSKLSAEERTTERLLSKLDFDFFEVLDSVTIARSRKHIEKYYDMKEIGEFPTRLPPKNYSPPLTDKKDVEVNYEDIFKDLDELNLSIYSPSLFIFPSRIKKYEEKYGKHGKMGISMSGRESGLKKLMAVNLLKRLESSIYSFRITTNRILSRIERMIYAIENYQNKVFDIDFADDLPLDFGEDDLDLYSIDGKYKLDFNDMDHESWLKELNKDKEILNNLLLRIENLTPEHDRKLQTMMEIIADKIKNPINNNNKKILIFTAFADTAEYLYTNLSKYALEKFGLNTAVITGSTEGKTTLDKMPTDFNTVLTCFSPVSKDRNKLNKIPEGNIDILIGTDCISEGQNLQDCDFLVNFDIHWNPVRIIQRFGRIDRIGSQNSGIQLVNFWPDLKLDEYINLKSRVETRMKISVMTATGDGNPIDAEEKGDLEYRKKQLEKLQKEVITHEEASGGITIMDLGLNEFRLDLIEYRKLKREIDSTPFGMHAVARAVGDLPKGVIYILKNIDNIKNSDSQNRLHPFYMVYLTEDGDVCCNHLEPKKALNFMRLLCKGKSLPDGELTKEFNVQTQNGYDMEKYSKLLQTSIQSIINVKEEKEIDSLFSDGGTSILSGDTIRGLSDFELICFLAVK